MNRLWGFLIRFALAVFGGLVGNWIATDYLIRGETEDDTRGIVAADSSTAWGKDDLVRVMAVIAGSMGVLRFWAKVRDRKKGK